ncbi:MAG: ArsB/NhaD family transporter, partial [Candidatus Thermoplasmatota archaeon]|nr:ArsB/NhaD family transporter [Candidatus Thermoplasmatota archaeon]
FFRWAALKVALLANGSGLRLYFYITLLTAVVSILFANDSAVLILTPIVLEIIVLLGIDGKSRIAYLFGAGLVADTAAMPLITSNPVNIVSADFFHYTFIDHLKFMAPVAIVTIILSILVVYLFFRKDVRISYSPDVLRKLMSGGQLISSRNLRVSAVVLVLIDVGYVVASLNRIPVSLVICSGAFFLLGFYSMTAAPLEGGVGTGRVARAGKILKSVNWDILVFMIGIFLVVQGLRHAGAVDALASLFRWSISLPSALSTLVPALVVTIGASAMNNWPMTMMGLLSIQSVAGVLPASDFTNLVFSNVIGNNLGPHFFPLGSLAILMWLGVMRSKGLKVRLIDYLKVGSVLSIIEVAAASLILWIEIYGLGMVLK